MKPHLLKLPAELRNRIYHHVVVVSNSSGLCTWKLTKEPALLATSRQIREEALPTFYGANTFVCPYSQLLERLLSSLSAEKLQLLRAVKIYDRLARYSCSHNSDWLYKVRVAARAVTGYPRLNYITPDALLFPILVNDTEHREKALWVTKAELCHYVWQAGRLRRVDSAIQG